MNKQSGRIQLLAVQIHSAGPIDRFREELAPLTVVFAPNERGKTTIVENIVACLFRERKDGIRLRKELLGSAKVTVRGIGEKALHFSTVSGAKKLDERIDSLGLGFPPNLFDLLVVKGAELEVQAQTGGLNRGIIKSLVSREQLYETLLQRLPGEIGYTRLENGILTAQRRVGLYKTYLQSGERLASLEDAADRFYNSLSRAEALASFSRNTELEQEQQQLQLAKRHAAFVLQRSIEQTTARLERFDEAAAGRFADNRRDYARLENELAEYERAGLRGRQARADLHWVEQARKRYEECLKARTSPAQAISLAASVCALATALLVYYLLPRLIPVFLAASAGALSLAILFATVLRRGLPAASARNEIAEIKAAVKDRFGSPLVTVADFDLLKSRLEREVGKTEDREHKRGAAEAELKILLPGIHELLQAAGYPQAPESQWGELAEQLKEQTRKLRGRLSRFQERLDGLEVDASDYLEQQPGMEYSRRREQELASELEKVRRKIGEQQDSDRELREQLIEHIGRDAAMASSLEITAEAIEARKREYQLQETDCLARMIAGHVLADALEAVRGFEDRQLASALNDPRITDLLRSMTAGRYERIGLEGDSLVVQKRRDLYPLADLSSGAREQVLMALRMGLASIVCGKRSLFLILDDAFQYSDWQRRELLIDQAVRAVQSGWQVLYLSMDDDIRDRFRRAGKSLDPGMFKYIEL